MKTIHKYYLNKAGLDETYENIQYEDNMLFIEERFDDIVHDVLRQCVPINHILGILLFDFE